MATRRSALSTTPRRGAGAGEIETAVRFWKRVRYLPSVTAIAGLRLGRSWAYCSTKEATTRMPARARSRARPPSGSRTVARSRRQRRLRDLHTRCRASASPRRGLPAGGAEIDLAGDDQYLADVGDQPEGRGPAVLHPAAPRRGQQQHVAGGRPMALGDFNGRGHERRNWDSARPRRRNDVYRGRSSRNRRKLATWASGC